MISAPAAQAIRFPRALGHAVVFVSEIGVYSLYFPGSKAHGIASTNVLVQQEIAQGHSHSQHAGPRESWNLHVCTVPPSPDQNLRKQDLEGLRETMRIFRDPSDTIPGSWRTTWIFENFSAARLSRARAFMTTVYFTGQRQRNRRDPSCETIAILPFVSSRESSERDYCGRA